MGWLAGSGRGGVGVDRPGAELRGGSTGDARLAAIYGPEPVPRYITEIADTIASVTDAEIGERVRQQLLAAQRPRRVSMEQALRNYEHMLNAILFVEKDLRVMKRFKKILKWTGIVLGTLVTILLIVNAVLVRITDSRLEKQLAAIREAGDPLSIAELLDAKPIPPEQNAAVYLDRAGMVFGPFARSWTPSTTARPTKPAIPPRPS